MSLLIRSLKHKSFLGAIVHTAAALDAYAVIDLPGLVLAVYLDRADRALSRAERAVNAGIQIALYLRLYRDSLDAQRSLRAVLNAGTAV